MMCELFGMSARRPTDLDSSLRLFGPRGGGTAHHADGWGLATFEGAAARVVKEPSPASASACLEFFVTQHKMSPVAVAHIRRANPAAFGRTLANTHPFERELDGRSWVFAHNGKLTGLLDDPQLRPRRFRPIGETDSEHVFCLLMDQLARHSARRPLDAESVAEALHPLVTRLAGLGELNFLLSNGDLLVAHAHTNLHALTRSCACEGQPNQRVTLLATVPLTAEQWRPLEPGTLHVYRGGEEVVALPGAVASLYRFSGSR